MSNLACEASQMSGNYDDVNSTCMFIQKSTGPVSVTTVLKKHTKKNRKILTCSSVDRVTTNKTKQKTED